MGYVCNRFRGGMIAIGEVGYVCNKLGGGASATGEVGVYLQQAILRVFARQQAR